MTSTRQERFKMIGRLPAPFRTCFTIPPSPLLSRFRIPPTRGSMPPALPQVAPPFIRLRTSRQYTLVPLPKPVNDDEAGPPKLSQTYPLHNPLQAPVALPGLIKNLPSNPNASNRLVPPLISTSTSIVLANAASMSVSPAGTICWPCMAPIRRD